MIEPQTGAPPTDGRYVAFVQCDSPQIRDWVEPEIAQWTGGKWHASRPVLGWAGPIPPMKRDVLPAVQEFDL